MDSAVETIFVTAAGEDQLEMFEKLLHEKFDTRCIGMIGAAEQLDKEMEVLHRTVRVINSELMETEADQKHVTQLLKDLGLTPSNIVKTPRMVLSASEAETIENSPILDGKQTTTLRSGTMRCVYLAQDFVDISEAIKCLALAMSKPKAGHMTQSIEMSGVVPERSAEKSIAVHAREIQTKLAWKCTWTVTRRSTSGVIARRGRHVLRHSSTVQNVIGLSSAESEYYALTREDAQCWVCKACLPTGT